MTPDMLFIKALSNAAERHNDKLASGLDSLSIDELENILTADEPEEEKVASADSFEQLCEMADQWGRELARKEYEKIASIIPPGVTQGAQRMVGGALNAAIHTPVAKRMAVGAGVGAVAGAVHNPGLDPQTGQPRSHIPGMMMGAGMGAMAGHAVGPAAQHIMSQPGAVGQYAQQAAAAARIPKPMAPATAGVAASPVTAPAQAPMQPQQAPMAAPGAPQQQQPQGAQPAQKPAPKKSSGDKKPAKKTEKKPEKKKE